MVEIILIGPPGTGKGTIAQFMEEKFEVRQISSGDLLREEVKKRSKTGKMSEPIMKAGKLVNDSLVSKLVEAEIMRVKKDFVLDGYPRTLGQASALDGMMERTHRRIELVLLIESSEETIIRRLSARRQCTKCGRIYGLDSPPKKDGVCDKCKGKLFQRRDDKPETIKKRLAVYEEMMLPIIDLYRKQGLIVKIDGNQKLDALLANVKDVVEEKIRRIRHVAGAC